jgi:ribonuclease HII
LTDSKLLSPKRREKLFALISAVAVAIGIGRTEVKEVDRLNIYWAAMEARRQAVEALPSTPARILVDGQGRSPAVASRSQRASRPFPIRKGASPIRTA